MAHIEFKALEVKLSVLSFKPGDLLVVDFGKEQTKEMLSRVTQVIGSKLPKGCNFVILQGEADMRIINTEDLEAADWFAEVVRRAAPQAAAQAIDGVMQRLRRQEEDRRSRVWWRRFLRFLKIV